MTIGLVLSLATLVLGPWRSSLPDPSLGVAAHEYLSQTSCWLILLGAMGLGMRFLDHPSRSLTYLAEGSYPLYILHQTVIVAVAFHLVRLPLGWPGQYALVLLAGMVLTFAAYEVVHRVRWLRPLFGLKA